MAKRSVRRKRKEMVLPLHVEDAGVAKWFKKEYAGTESKK